MWKKIKYPLLIILITIPTFWKMLSFGIFSMQDFHIFRLYELNQCVQRFEIPCRWAQDSGMGYGEPLFNFYGQMAYWPGEIGHLLGLGFIDSTKLIFILSLIGSALSMYFLSKELWKNNLSAVFSTILYTYAPYRAVDVWVRGALPEAFSFILFPLIILSVEKKSLFYFSLLTFLLITTHNLSFVMFLPILLVWIIYRKWWKGFFGFLISGVLSSFYVLPLLFESKYINLGSTTVGYFDFRAHFITLKQIFLDTKWGYGGSTWGDGDGLNLSIGILQWFLPVIITLIILLTKKVKNNLHFFILITVATIYLLLTHNKTAFIWEALPFMKFIQFPWRFLGVSLFCLSLASGVIFSIVKNKLFIISVFILLSVYCLFYTSHWFSPDIWYSEPDSYFLTGPEWDRQRTASVGDFWPEFGHKIPDKISDGKYINYFPGWESSAPLHDGLIPAEGSKFKDTPIRIVGNLLSLFSLVGLFIWKRKLS